MQNSAEYFPPPPVEGVSGGGTGYGWVDAGLRRPDATHQQETSDLLHVWSMPNTANVGHQEQPRSLEHIAMLAARNEKESVQLALRPKVTWAGGSVAGFAHINCTQLCSDSSHVLDIGRSITICRVVPMLGVPDALVPLKLPGGRIALQPGETMSLWVSVYVPPSQPPGIYNGEIIINAMKGDAICLQSNASTADKEDIRSAFQDVLSKVNALEQKSLSEMTGGIQGVRAGLEQLQELCVASSGQFGNGNMDIDEDTFLYPALRVKLSVTVWDFVLPITPSLPAVFGISETVIEDRFNLEHRSSAWYDALDMHHQWLLKYRISPYFCRWGDNMRVLTYTCPWPADHPKADEYYSDPRLAVYAVAYTPALSSSSSAKEMLRKEVEVLRTKPHWKKAYFYLWDEPLSLEHYDMIRTMSEEIRSSAPDARVLTTYYCGPSDFSYAPGSFEAFVKVPSILRPHTQIFCTSEWVLGSREDLVKDITSELQPENNEEWWTYVCMGPADPHPNWHLGMRGTQHRAVMWRAWKEGGTGFLYWGANCYEKALSPGAEVRFRRGLPPGDGILFYPGQLFDPELTEPVASLRLERLLSGLQDYEYLQLYASRFGRPAALALVEKTGLYFGPDRYTHDHGAVDLMRGEIYHSLKVEH
ncbi:hypothetical protein L7F22_010624 [Adiantum nelumboides]|nr:hypothetical protein [Adiantum nelumboides]